MTRDLLKELKVERAELSYKISKLYKTITHPSEFNIDEEHHNMLRTQHEYMKMYQAVLEDRISLLKEIL